MKGKFELLTLSLCLFATAVHAGPPASQAAVNVIRSVEVSEEKEGI
jgi:hypothetical protein